MTRLLAVDLVIRQSRRFTVKIASSPEVGPQAHSRDSESECLNQTGPLPSFSISFRSEYDPIFRRVSAEPSIRKTCSIRAGSMAV